MSKCKSTSPLQRLQQYCEDHALRFTPPRRDVLAVFAASDAPMGAYQVLDALSTEDHKPRPPTIYRAIEFLSEHGFIHRIESLNAYVLCCADHRHDAVTFAICDDCGSVSEASDPTPTPDTKRLPKGFIARAQITEIHGSCGKCN